MSYETAAEAQFHTSSVYPVPKGYTAWEIRNDYPIPNLNFQRIQSIQKKQKSVGLPIGLPPGEQDPTPWRDVDFQADPVKYLELVKEYFLEGMIESDFVLKNNTVRFLSLHCWQLGFTMNNLGQTMVSRIVVTL